MAVAAVIVTLVLAAVLAGSSAGKLLGVDFSSPRGHRATRLVARLLIG